MRGKPPGWALFSSHPQPSRHGHYDARQYELHESAIRPVGFDLGLTLFSL